MAKKMFDEDFRKAHPQTVGETDSHFDLDNYTDWLDKEHAALKKKVEEQTKLLEMSQRKFEIMRPHVPGLGGILFRLKQYRYHGNFIDKSTLDGE